MKKKSTSKKMKDLEEHRQTIEHNYYVLIVITVILTTFFFILFGGYGVLIALLISGILGTTYVYNDLTAFNKKYKNTIVAEVFKQVFTEVNYQINTKTDDKRFYIKLFKNKDKTNFCTSHDYINALYNDIGFECADIMWRNKKNDMLFYGQWYIFNLNKRFKDNVFILEKHFYEVNRKRLGLNQFNIVEVEDIDFNDQFVILTKNNIDAFYILTPQIIEKTKEINSKIYGHLIVHFIDNKIHIGINSSKNKFEANIHKKLDISEIEKQTLNELKTIINLIEILDLNKNLFRKED